MVVKDSTNPVEEIPPGMPLECASSVPRELGSKDLGGEKQAHRTESSPLASKIRMGYGECRLKQRFRIQPPATRTQAKLLQYGFYRFAGGRGMKLRPKRPLASRKV